jgi:hypothetical protein
MAVATVAEGPAAGFCCAMTWDDQADDQALDNIDHERARREERGGGCRSLRPVLR